MCRVTFSVLFLIVLFASATQSIAAGGDVRLADATMHSDRDMVRSLIQQKADVNATQADGMTALHWAVRQNDLDTAKYSFEPAQSRIQQLDTG